MNNNVDINNVDLLDKHIGGNNNDSIKSFNNQINIVNNQKNNYNRLIDYFNKIDREKNNNDNFVERIDNEQHAAIYRINNFPTYVDDINYSNPIIYPKEYDPYFDYLDKKNINPINTQIVKKKEYLNIDSTNRIITSSLNINKYLNIKDYGLEFKNNSNTFKIYLEYPVDVNRFILDDFIILRGFKSYINYYDNLNFFFTNGSPIVIIDIKPNFLTTISYTNITIIIEILDSTVFKYWKNIPYFLLNGLKIVFVKNFDVDERLAFELPINFYSTNVNDNILKLSCKITFNCLGNYPINLINANTPLTSANLTDYLTISNITTNYIEVILNNTLSLNDNISLDGYWTNDSFFTGKNIQIGRIEGFIQGYISVNNFNIFLNKTYNNVAEIKIISSEIPNVQKNIIKEEINDNFVNVNYRPNMTYLNSTTNLKYIEIPNNKFYWENILDSEIYHIELDIGNYSYELLKKIIEYKVSRVSRKPIIDNNYLVKSNNIEVEFIEEINESRFRMFDIYKIPNCFVELINNSTSTNNVFIIKIYFQNHNLVVGDTIFISNSLSYYEIDNKYINTITGHKVVNVNDENYYEILISNINLIENVGNTKGGFSIEIKKSAIFRLFFNFKDTFGRLLGFKLTGNENSITKYSNSLNNYIITNKQQYYNDISSVLIVNNIQAFENLSQNFQSESYNYILLLIEGLNNNNNPNGPAYFYKFLINQPSGNFLFNTFVNSPVYFNPPIRSLNELKLSLVYPNGGLVNMGNLNYSLTFEITTINNLPENTNVNTNMSRI